MSLIKKTFPLLFVSFINTIGKIGLTLLPLLLVEKQISTDDSSAIMGTVKGFRLLGLWGGGWLGDVVGLRATMILSFILNGAGLLLLPLMAGVGTLGLAAVAAQVGNSMYPSSARLLLVRLIGRGEQQEALGWLRMSNNLGQIVAFGSGALFAGLGAAFFMYFDATTSLLAAITAYFLFKNLGQATKRQPREANSNAGSSGGEGLSSGEGIRPWIVFYAAAMISCCFTVIYEIYMIGASAKYRIVFGSDGLAIFSTALVINTTICTVLAVPAARWIKKPQIAIPIGIFLTALGTSVLTFPQLSDSSLERSTLLTWVYLGAFLVTIGEVVFASLISLVLIRKTPSHPKWGGSIYGTALVIQAFGAVVAGVITFPMIVHGTQGWTILVAMLGVSALLMLLIWRDLKEL